MYTKQPKKLLIMNILDILKRYSDVDHRLSQRDIIDILRKEYDMTADRKAVKRNLMDLIDFGYEIDYREVTRRTPNPRTGELEENTILTDFCLMREFNDAELRLLIDSLLFSKHIPYSQCKELIGKIESLSNQYFRSKVRHVQNLPVDQPKNAELFYTIEILDEAIEKNRQVVFHYGDYCTDKKLHLRLDSSGQPRSYLVNPYQMVATNGRYYLIGNMDKYDNVAHYRIDRIRDIELLDTLTKPQREVEGLEHGLDLPRHMAEHVYMFSGESARVTMRTKPDMAGDLIDWFGSGVTFTDETEDSVIAHVTANLQAMRCWALQYAPYVTVLGPQSLVETVKEDLISATATYTQANG